MKTFLKLSLTLLLVTFLSACSSDDDDSNNASEIETELLGQWYFNDPAIVGYGTNNSFTFTSEGNVTYSYRDGTVDNSFDSETGTFSFNRDVMTMVFPDNVTLTFVQKVVFINANKVEFQSTGVSGEEPYDGDYFRADPVDIIPPSELKLTVTGTTFNDQCETTGVVLNNSYDVKIAFSSDGTEISSESFIGTNAININEYETLTGDVILMKATLENSEVNFPDTGKGTGLKDIVVKVEDLDGNTIVEENLNNLLICTDATYEIWFQYNKTNNEFSIDYITHGF